MQLVPRARRTAQNIQYTYSLNTRTHDVKTYPVQSPQGATIILYGHQNGLTVVWRGGQPFKAPSLADKADGRNGPSMDDAVMIMDSDEEQPAPSSTSAEAFVDKPEFDMISDDDKEEAGASPLLDITQTLHLPFGTAVLRLAVLPMPPCPADEAAWGGAHVLKDKMVFAVACATNDVYVVTLPLTPPSHQSKARPELQQNLMAGRAGRGSWGETLVLLRGQGRPCDGLAMTLVKRNVGSRSRSMERASGIPPSLATRIAVAAHSREASGTLRLWDVALEQRPSALTPKHVEPFQTEYLSSPLTSVSFNPSHPSQLLAVSSRHAVRIYDYAVPSMPGEDTSEGPFPTQGSWLLSMYPPFVRGPGLSGVRKPIADAAWISQGRAVLVLLVDGQWGIWDIEGVGPTPFATAKGNASLFAKARPAAGLRGSAVTTFSVTGHLEGTSPLRGAGTQKSSSGDLVPMTPHSRREALAAAVSAAGGDRMGGVVRGGITVTQLPVRQGTGTPAAPDESAVLWLAGADPVVAVIPVVYRFWESQLRRAAGGGFNLWSGAQPTRMVRLTNLGAGLLGERCTGAVSIVRWSRHEHGQAAAAMPNAHGGEKGTSIDEALADGLPIEVMLRGESRLVVIHECDGDGVSSLQSRLLSGTRKRIRHAGMRAARAILAYPPPSADRLDASLYGPRTDGRADLADGDLHVTRQRPRLFPNTTESALLAPPAEGGNDMDESSFGNARSGLSFAFANNLELAANVPEEEANAENRDVDREVMDIMQIDRELDVMEMERESGTKHVFFEEG